jgi:hypothetical protein
MQACRTSRPTKRRNETWEDPEVRQAHRITASGRIRFRVAAARPCPGEAAGALARQAGRWGQIRRSVIQFWALCGAQSSAKRKEVEMGVIRSRRLSWLSQSRCCPRTVPPTPRGFCPALVPTRAGLHVRVFRRRRTTQDVVSEHLAAPTAFPEPSADRPSSGPADLKRPATARPTAP